MRVVLTREKGSNDALLAWMPAGAQVREVALTSTRYVDLDAFASTLGSSPSWGTFRSMVVTSARSAPFAKAALAACDDGVEVFSVGVTTSASLRALGIEVAVQSPGGALGLAPSVARGPVLALGAAGMRDELLDALRARGLEVSVAACYETEPVVLGEADLVALREADVVLIGAPSAWDVAREHVGATTLVVVPGRTTGDAVRETHERVIEGWGPSLRDRLASLVEADGDGPDLPQ